MSDIVGSLLLVGITVLAAGALGLLLWSFDGPPDQVHMDLELRTAPGADGDWDTGDERMELVHLGGEALPREGTIVSYTADGTQHRYVGGQLAGAFSDGQLTIGEVWTSPAGSGDYLTVTQDEAVAATLSTEHEVSQLLAAGTVNGGGIVLSSGGGSCAPDTAAPSVTLSHSPANLDSDSGSVAVTVTAVATDSCSAVDTDAADLPHLWYRISPGPAPGPSSFTDLGAMPLASSTASSWTFERAIPAPSGGWQLAWGQALQFYVAGAKDTAPSPNTLFQSATRSDTIDLIGTSSFADYSNEVAGVYSNTAAFPNVQADDGVYAMLPEACTSGPPAANVQGLCGTSGGGTSVSNAASAIRSDDQRSTMTGSGTSVHVTGFDVPQSTTATVSSFTIAYEGQRGVGGATNPTVQLEYQFSAACAGTWTAAGSAFSVTGTADATTTRTVSAGGPFDLATVQSLCVRARVTNAATRPLLTDALTVSVTYPSATTTYDLNVEYGWSGLAVDGSSTGLLSIDYRTASGETYTVEKFNGVGWTACSGSLASTAGATFQCALTTAELLLGNPLVRVVGAADAGAPTTFQVDAVSLAVFT